MMGRLIKHAAAASFGTDDAAISTRKKLVGHWQQPGVAGWIQRPSNLRNEIALVEYFQLVASPANEERGIVRPLCDNSRVEWALNILEAHYPERKYQAVALFAPEGVTAAQIAEFEVFVVDDLTRLALAKEYLKPEVN
ncbi:MAG: hypothetical protein ACRBBM_10985 [Pseudomonadaceae bacterium]|jgi:hypothetical protein